MNTIPYKALHGWCFSVPKKVLQWQQTGRRGSGAGAKSIMGAELELLLGKLWVESRDNLEETTRAWMVQMAHELNTNDASKMFEKWFRNVRRLFTFIICMVCIGNKLEITSYFSLRRLAQWVLG
jgi:hypothetical protein